MATHEASALEFTVEPGDHKDRAVPEGFQTDFSSVEPGQRGDPLRKRLAGYKAWKFGRVRLEDVRARGSPYGPRPSAVYLDEEQLRLKPSKGDSDVLIDAEWVLPQCRDRLLYLGRGKWLQRADIPCEILAWRQDRDSSGTVTPQSGEQSEPIATSDAEILLQNRPRFALGKKAFYPAIDQVSPEPAAADRHGNREPECPLASLGDIIIAIAELRNLSAVHRQVSDDTATQPHIKVPGFLTHGTGSPSPPASTVTLAPRGTAIRS